MSSTSSSSAGSELSIPSDRGFPSARGRGYRRRAPRGRGRGQGKGRGKGRARGRGRGQTGSSGQTRADVALHILETRKERFMNALEEMSQDRMRELLVELMEKSPLLILDVFEPQEPQSGVFHPPAGNNTPDWCTCNHCRKMPIEDEKVCCGMMPEQCVSLLPKEKVTIVPL